MSSPTESSAPPEALTILQAFIERADWTYAKTMPSAPHTYAVRAKCVASGLITDDEFTEAVGLSGSTAMPAGGAPASSST